MWRRLAGGLDRSVEEIESEYALAVAWLSTTLPRPASSAAAHALYCDAMRLPPGERDAFVRAGAADDDASAAFVLGCVAQHDRSSWLDEPIGTFLPELFDPGEIEVGPYTITKKIGSGSMGEVYLARDEHLKRDIALKILSRQRSKVAGDTQSVLREARASARLDHPGIVPVFEAGHNGAAFWIASAYVEGGSLRERLDALDPAERHTRGWVDHAVVIVARCAEAIQHAHDHGVIHRDVKPSNILLGERGAPRLVDFGIAHTPGERFETILHHAGTTPYMSPERAREEERTPHPRSDVYSLGVVLYECLTGALPFPGRTLAELLGAHDGALPRSIRSVNRRVPRGLEAVCFKALELDPRRRYQSAQEFADDLRRALGGEAVAGLQRFARPRAWASRRRLPLIAGAVVVASVAIVAAALHTPVPSGVLVIPGEGTRVAVYPLRGGPQHGPGEAVYEGTLPLRKRLPEGDYRAVVYAGTGTIELSREIRAGETVVAEPPESPAWWLASDMIHIPAGPAVVGREDMDAPAYARRTIELPAYWIDRYEVSNAEYRAFVQATGAEAPAIWPSPYDPAFDHLPVVGVSRDEARAYAEWAGKRLPTANEWERAAASAEGFMFPWGNDAPPPPADPVGPGLWSIRPGTPEGRDHYLRYVRAINDGGQDVSPEGGVNFFGNVAEWTETRHGPVSPEEGFIIKGTDWARAVYSGAGLTGVSYGQTTTRALHIGFRCARTSR